MTKNQKEQEKQKQISSKIDTNLLICYIKIEKIKGIIMEKQVRCPNCNKLLFIAKGFYNIQIKCDKCKKITNFIAECQEHQSSKQIGVFYIMYIIFLYKVNAP